MGQIFSRHGGTILALVAIIGIDIHLLFIIKPLFHEIPTTEVWFCLAWMGMITEAGITLIVHKLKHLRDETSNRDKGSNPQ